MTKVALLVFLSAGVHGHDVRPALRATPVLALRGGGQGVEVAKTFLPQKSFGFGLWKEGFETWHIAMFTAGLVGGNAALLLTGLIDRPTPGTLPLDQLLQPSNPIFKLFLLTTVLLFAKTHFVMWAQVWLGCKNNRFSKNPWDTNTGSRKAPAAISTESDLAKSTMHNIHGNDLENIPLTLFLHALLVLLQPTQSTATLIMATYTASRFLHTFWYAFYGSHEIRAMIFSVGCWANYAAVFQILAACGIL